MQTLSHPRHNRSTLVNRVRGLCLAALAFGGCSAFAPAEPELPAGAVRLDTQPQYAAWFERTEACSGLTGQFKQIQWFVVPGAETFQTSAGPKVGMWEKAGSVARIIIAGNYVGHEMVVRHEILHHLLDREGHPAEYFVNRCRLTWESWSTTYAAR